MLTARRKRKSRTTNYSVSTGRELLAHRRTAPQYVGKLRKDPSGRHASVYDGGNNPDRPGGELPGRGLRRELLAIMETKEDSSAARAVSALVPNEDAVPTPAPKKMREGGDGEGTLLQLYEAVGREGLHSTALLETRPPPGDPRRGPYCHSARPLPVPVGILPSR